ncbi:MAG: hypothetical protein ABIC19_00880, partial [Patescibacteria group bacterium]
GFCFDRASVVKAFAPLILQALKRKIKIFLLCGPDARNSWPNNPKYQPLKKNIYLPYNIKKKVNFLYFKNNQRLEKLIIKNKISHFFTLHFEPRKFGKTLPNLRKNNIKICCLQWTGDFTNVSPRALAQVDWFFVYSSWIAKLYCKIHPACLKNKLRKKIIPCGNPILDSVYDLARPEEIRQKYRLPQNKKIVLLLTLDPFYPWAKWVFTAQSKIQLFLNFRLHRDPKLIIKYCRDTSYKQILQALRNWCEKNNALLIGKSRSRHREPLFLKEICHKVILEDKDWYPIMSTELMSIADLLVNFNSAGIWEAAFFKVYGLTIDVLDTPGRSHLLPFRRDPKMYQFKGVGRWIDYKKFPGFLERHSLSDFKVDKNQQKKYIKRYLEFEKPQASRIIINHLIKMS